MKVLALNGSPRPIGNTSNILHEVTDLFEREGIEVEIVYLYEYQFVNCNVCLTCEIRGDGRCIDEDDGFNDLLDRMRQADGILLAAPTYANACPSMMQTFLERAMLVLEKGDLGLRGKVGGAFAVCGHDGATMVYNQLVDFMLKNGESAVALMKQLLEGLLNEEGESFLNIIGENQRFEVLPEIYEEFVRLKNEHDRVLKATVTSARALEAAELKALSDKLSSKYACEVTLENVIDPSIMGGAILKVGDEVIDASVKTSLKSLSSTLK